MRTNANICLILGVVLGSFVLQTAVHAQPGLYPREALIQYTPEWKGERFPDGRPKVPDSILKRMESVAIEEAWSVLRGKGYEYQFTRDWKMTRPGEVLVGRAVTAQWVPKRPDFHDAINAQGAKDGRIGAMPSWTIDTLVKGDVYVASAQTGEVGGPIIGGNLATSIFSKTGKGVVFDGEIRDLEQLEGIEGMSSFVTNWNPTYSWNNTLIGINVPIQIKNATVLPGDVVLAKREGVIFIPPHLAEQICKTSELVRLRDEFGFMRLKEGKYTPGEVDGRWTDVMEKDFSNWLQQNMDRLTVPKEQIQEILKERTW